MTVLFSVDGMRPDGMVQADTPTIDSLMQRGSYSLSARSVMPSVSLPCHLSMLRGVDVPRHGITTNRFQPLAHPVPSLVEVAHAAGLRTGSFYNWEPLRDLSEPGSLDVAHLDRDCYSLDGDRRIADAAARHVAERPFDLLFVYLGYTDECAHRHDWMSAPYLEAIANADQCIAKVLSAYQSVGLEPAALVLSDHGGHARSHGTDCPEDMTIPWVLAGPGVRSSGELHVPISLCDVAPTMSALMGLKPADEWEGRAISEALF